MRIDVHHHFHFDGASVDLFQTLLDRSNTIMATLDDINAALANLSATIAAEKQQVADAVTALQAQIQALQDQIANGGVVTAADLDAVVAAVNDLNTAVQNIQEPGAV